MVKIVFIGAGSTVFAKNVLGDAMMQPALHEAEIALYDIDAERLRDSEQLIGAINTSCNGGRARISAWLGEGQRRAALRGADYVVNAVQIGGYDPCTLTDFDIPARYGLRQTIADTLGIGGIFRALRTIPVLLAIARDMEAVCPDAWLLNYTNPMCMITGAILRGSAVRTVGLCHSVQGCVADLLSTLSLKERFDPAATRWRIAGINHQAWLLELEHRGRDLYPEVEQVARAGVDRVVARGAGAWAREVVAGLDLPADTPCYEVTRIAQRAADEGRLPAADLADLRIARDLVRLEMLVRFGYYVTESSEHNAEYAPWFIKEQRPELIDRYNIPLDEYPRRCRRQIADWQAQRERLLNDPTMEHSGSCEFGAGIMQAMESDVPYRIAGNVGNQAGLIGNLPRAACVEVPCLVDRNGVQPCAVGDLPEQCAAMNRTNIGPQLLTIEAALTGRRDHVYQAAMLDPHTAAELPIDDIVALCDDLIAAHGDWLPPLR